MRIEIKFRAWNMEEGNMQHFPTPFIQEGGALAFSFMHDGPSRDWKDGTGISDGRIILMQYTGLKDKNGKEIYEGDVLCEVEDDLEGGQEGTFMEVYFDTFGCWQLRGNSMVNGEMLYDHYKYAEIIGNVYENPDLLSTSQE